MASIRIPADVERPDRILAGLSARQLGIVSVGAVAAWALWLPTRHLVPAPVLIGLLAPIVGLAAVAALTSHDGLPADRLALAAWRWHRGPRRLVRETSPASLPAWAAPAAEALPAQLALPARDIDAASGVIDLGDDGSALLARASSVNFALRSDAEQVALVAGFGRVLNALVDPLQVVVRAHRVELAAVVTDLQAAAGGLPHPALEAAALEHAAFLASLAERRDLLRRQVVVVLRHVECSDAAGVALARRAEEMATLLGAVGIALHPLDGHDAMAVLASASDPEGGDADVHGRRRFDTVSGQC